jgi:Fe-S-cluster containining protein
VSSSCQRCGAKCCRYFCFQIEKPQSFEEFENVRWFLLHEGITVHVEEEGDWYIAIANPCREIGDDGSCRVYEHRPVICRKYDAGNCDATPGDYEYAHLFRTPRELEAYARKVVGDKLFDEARGQMYGRLARNHARRERRRQARAAASGKAK